MEITATIKKAGNVTANINRPSNVNTSITRIGGAAVTVDPALDGDSTNPVENKAIVEGLAGKQNAALIVTTTPFEIGQGIIFCTLSETYANIRAAIHAGRDVYVWDNGDHLYPYTTELTGFGLVFGTTVCQEDTLYTRGVLVMSTNYGAYIATSTQIPTVPSELSAFSNDVGYITSINSADVTTALGFTPYNATNPNGYVNALGAASAAPVQSVNGQTGDVTGLQPAGNYASSAAGDATHTAVRAAGVPMGKCDSTSTSTAFTATVDGVTSYYNGLTILLYNGVVTSASGFTININGLGALPSYSNMALGNPVTPTTPTRDTTIFNINYAMLISYSDIVSGGCWIMYRGYDANTNTIGYQIRTNSSTMPMKSVTYRYRLLFTAADGNHWVPANNSTSTNATASRTVCQDAIDPFGEIVYYGTTASVAANSNPSASYLWQEYNFSLGYSFNRTGAALVLPYPKSIYVKAAPQADGSAIIDSAEPYVTDLPTTNDGKIYIYLGRTYSATNIELVLNHPVYYHNGNGIRLWTGGT